MLKKLIDRNVERARIKPELALDVLTDGDLILADPGFELALKLDRVLWTELDVEVLVCRLAMIVVPATARPVDPASSCR